ncbi:MAG TPA: hypothetical protein VFR09_08175 [Alphaproteobacteria bacterium]|nr:hypothetical protein [Alphaproteobacteria bacterium]
MSFTELNDEDHQFVHTALEINGTTVELPKGFKQLPEQDQNRVFKNWALLQKMMRTPSPAPGGGNL